MTIKEIIEQLQTVEDKSLPLYIEAENSDMYKIDWLSLFDNDEEHSGENMLSVSSEILQSK